MTPHLVAGGGVLGESVLTYVAYAAQLSIGGVFAVSAVAKLRNPRRFVETVADYDVVPSRLAPIVAGGVVLVEALLAVCLVGNLLLPIALPLAAVTFAGFLVVVAISLKRGRYVDCGCFGASSEPISGVTVVRLALLGSAAVLGAIGRLVLQDSSAVGGRGLLSSSVTAANVVLTLSFACAGLLAASWLLKWREVRFVVGNLELGRGSRRAGEVT